MKKHQFIQELAFCIRLLRPDYKIVVLKHSYFLYNSGHSWPELLLYMSETKNFYKETAKNLNETDFWGQVRRTINGEPVSEEHIKMIVNQVKTHLAIQSNDRILDLCCGNGALSDRLFQLCSSGVGVDFSEYLIRIAQKYFTGENQQFIESDVVAYTASTSDRTFTLGQCYGSLQFLGVEGTKSLIHNLLHNYNLKRFFIGNVPDRTQADNFFKKRNITNYALDDIESAIGYWWNPDELKQLTESSGWKSTILRMPPEYYNQEYRFDLLLERV